MVIFHIFVIPLLKVLYCRSCYTLWERDYPFLIMILQEPMHFLENLMCIFDTELWEMEQLWFEYISSCFPVIFSKLPRPQTFKGLPTAWKKSFYLVYKRSWEKNKLSQNITKCFHFKFIFLLSYSLPLINIMLSSIIYVQYNFNSLLVTECWIVTICL